MPKRREKGRDIKASTPCKRRKTKWCIEPFLSKMRSALYRIRIKGHKIFEVSKQTQIPPRTLRRYNKLSKNPENELFFIQEPDDDDPIVSWKPESSVPMFSLPLSEATQLKPPIVNPSISDESYSNTITPDEWPDKDRFEILCWKPESSVPMFSLPIFDLDQPVPLKPNEEIYLSDLIESNTLFSGLN